MDVLELARLWSEPSAEIISTKKRAALNGEEPLSFGRCLSPLPDIANHVI